MAPVEQILHCIAYKTYQQLAGISFPACFPLHSPLTSYPFLPQPHPPE